MSKADMSTQASRQAARLIEEELGGERVEPVQVEKPRSSLYNRAPVDKKTEEGEDGA